MGGPAVTWDLAAIEAMIGERVTYTAPEPIGRASIRYFAEAIESTNPVYVDVDAARAAGHDDVIAPPTWLCETNQYVGSRDRDHAGYKGHAWDLPVRDCRLIRGGNTYTFHRHAGPDDVVTATWEITSAVEKTSGSGTPMLLVGSRAHYTNQHGHDLVTNDETLIFQSMAADGEVGE